jgi:hypothetical protein
MNLLTMQLLILSQLTLVKGLYVIQLQLLGYDNPTQQRIFCNSDRCFLTFGVCCDDGGGSCGNGNRRCDTFFIYCLRPLGTNGFDCGSNSGSEIQSGVNENDAVINFSQSTVLGLSNPINLPGLTNDWNVSVLVVHIVFAVITLVILYYM